MIVFDGVSLNSVADIKIEDVRVSPIAYDEVTRPRAIQGGSVFVRSRAGTRTVSITFALLDMDKINRQKALLAISTWAKNDKEYKLELPGHPEHYLMAICTGKPEPSLRQWWESKLRLVFTCYDNPFWNAKAERVAPCNDTFIVLGNAVPLMRIERTITGAPVINEGYSSDGRVMSFSTTPVGKLVIDLNNQLASVDGINIMQYYNLNSRFILPRTGVQAILGTGTVYFRERWQ